MMLGNTDQANIYTSFEGMADLRYQAQKNDPKALETVAQQFEAIFLQMMLKSMRDAGIEDSLFDNNQSRMFLDMYDKQIAQDMSRNPGIGLAEMMIQQIQGLVPATPEAGEAAAESAIPQRGVTEFKLHAQTADVAATNTAAGQHPSSTLKVMNFESPEQFVEVLWPEAERASKDLGVAPELLLAQAALETGWGKHVIKDAQGDTSHNLFNIKADHRWEGERVGKLTLEYRDGVALKENAQFRAYGSYEESFRDYVDFLKGSSRYAPALEVAHEPGAFIEELHRAGYATDPSYADKIKNIVDGPLFKESLAALKVSSKGTLS